VASSPDALIRIGELSRRVGVSVDRLRAWERRYDLIRPTRTAGGFRLYSALDELRLRDMQRHLAAGLSAAEAAAAALGTHTPTPAVETVPVKQRRRELSDAMSAFDAARADVTIDRLFAEIGVDDALRSVILPCLHDLGERWARAEIRVGDEHFASNLIQARMLSLLRAPAAGAGPTALLACAPGELHTLGLIGFAIALRNRGWRTTYLGADTPIADIQRLATETAPAITVLSGVTPARFADVREALRDLAASTRLALAGAGASPALAKATGAHLLEGDPITEADAIATVLPPRAQ
jgi:DNA-binding transcriptional MerR regulator